MTMSLTPTEVFKCLADETRVKTTLLVQQEGELCVCELTHALDQLQPKISRHLALLRACGLLADRRQGQWVYYRLNPDLPSWIPTILRETADANKDWLQKQSQRLKTMGERPSRSACC